jgi:hypothetical protein
MFSVQQGTKPTRKCITDVIYASEDPEVPQFSLPARYLGGARPTRVTARDLSDTHFLSYACDNFC